MSVQKLERKKSFHEALLLEPCNVAGIFKLDKSFYNDEQKLQWSKNVEEYDETLPEEIKQDLPGDKLIMKRTLVSKEFVNWFLKVVRAFNQDSKIKMEQLSFFENKKANHPIVVAYRELAMVLAPRVEDDKKSEVSGAKVKQKAV